MIITKNNLHSQQIILAKAVLKQFLHGLAIPMGILAILPYSPTGLLVALIYSFFGVSIYAKKLEKAQNGENIENYEFMFFFMFTVIDWGIFCIYLMGLDN